VVLLQIPPPHAAIDANFLVGQAVQNEIRDMAVPNPCVDQIVLISLSYCQYLRFQPDFVGGSRDAMSCIYCHSLWITFKQTVLHIRHIHFLC